MPLDAIAETLQAGFSRVTLTDTLKFDCGEDGVIVLADGQVIRTDRDADCTIRISSANLDKLIRGKLNPMTAFAMGKIKISGDMSVAMKLGQLLKG
ncbi:SCP2 sterol-binding domain-containing protein [Thalassococcus sp. S3]|uniref:SCP2 sterol-binding domain-containing protein n=1 Tax=Thalassococcus sp. S3 TaxID=2017482 RepID=UPI0010240987|nr:SCP2 sterol-binding domain-containing protein [Thalassococcus sp. S3]QBF34129.1 sterol carrier protein [Thalassococcus sp. S3]